MSHMRVAKPKQGSLDRVFTARKHKVGSTIKVQADIQASCPSTIAEHVCKTNQFMHLRQSKSNEMVYSAGKLTEYGTFVSGIVG